VTRTAFALLVVALLASCAAERRHQADPDPAPVIIPCPPEGLICIPV